MPSETTMSQTNFTSDTLSFKPLDTYMPSETDFEEFCAGRITIVLNP